MTDAKALLEAGLAAREQAKQDAIAAAQRQAQEEANHAREAADERVAALRREHQVQLSSIERLHTGELERQREVHRAAMAARERQFEQQLLDAAALHQAQLTAYERIESQGGVLHNLASQVQGSAEALGGLREKMDGELWKGVLKSEAALMEKERSLNEVQAKREQLWGQREAIVTAMQAELQAEQQRMARQWAESQTSWASVQTEHASLRSELTEQRRTAQEQVAAALQEVGGANASLQAEIKMLDQERAACRTERRSLGVALLQHKAEVTQHREWLFGKIDHVNKQREEGVYQLASEGAKLEAQKRAADVSSKNAAYERSLVAKEREALSGHLGDLQEKRDEAERERHALNEASARLADAREAVVAFAGEAEEQRLHVSALAEATKNEASLILERQRQLQEHAIELLRTGGGGSGGGSGGGDGGHGAGATPSVGGGAPPAHSGARTAWGADDVARANYTASGLGLFAIPLLGSRAGGLPAQQMASIEEATRATTSTSAAPPAALAASLPSFAHFEAGAAAARPPAADAPLAGAPAERAAAGSLAVEDVQ